MTHTNSNLERTYKKREEDFVHRDRKRDKNREKFQRRNERRAVARRMRNEDEDE